MQSTDPGTVFANLRSGLNEFTITDDHLKLLDRLQMDSWDDCEFGAPSVDPKRPYGNSDVLTDIAEIVGLPQRPDDDDYWDFPAEQVQHMVRLHAEMGIVLQIGVTTRQFQAGRYVRSGKYGSDWKLAGDE